MTRATTSTTQQRSTCRRVSGRASAPSAASTAPSPIHQGAPSAPGRPKTTSSHSSGSASRGAGRPASNSQAVTPWCVHTETVHGSSSTGSPAPGSPAGARCARRDHVAASVARPATSDDAGQQQGEQQTERGEGREQREPQRRAPGRPPAPVGGVRRREEERGVREPGQHQRRHHGAEPTLLDRAGERRAGAP